MNYKKLKLSAILLLGLGLSIALFSVEAQNQEAQTALRSVDRQFFIENKGQWPDEVLYLTRMGGLDAWITTKGVNYTFYKLEEVKNAKQEEQHLPDKFEHKDYNIIGHRVLYELQGNNLNVSREGKQKQSGYYNYFICNDPSKHATYVGLYKQAVVKNVYNGIDVRYYFDKGSLRYDYIVSPGADPSQIAFTLKGSDKTYLNDKGNLVFTTRFGEVQMAELYCYQSSDKKPVQCRFTHKGNAWSIQVSAYDKTQTLVIDPLIYSTYIGGSDGDEGYSIAIDDSGNAYVTGLTGSTDYDTTAGAFQTTIGGGVDVFVTKLNATGTALLYSTYLGGSGWDYGKGIAIDGSGNAYVTGYTRSTDYDTTAGAFQTTIGGDADVFVTKLNATGTVLLYSTYLGGSDSDYGSGIVIDGSGNAYVTGYTRSTDYDTTAGAFQTTIGGDADVFVTKLNATGTALLYSTYLGGSGDDRGYSIAIDDSGNAYVTGYTDSTDYDTTAGAFQTTYGGGYADAFVTKLNASGNALLYSTYLGGSGSDYGSGIAIDGSGNAYVTGFTFSNDYDTTTGTFQTTPGGFYDVFVTKLNASGTALLYSTYLGGSGWDYGISIAIDGNGNAYVTGYTDSGDYDITAGAFQTTPGGGDSDAFVTKLNTTGTALLYSTYLGGSDEDNGKSIAVDGSGNAYVTGFTNSNDYDITSGAFQTTPGGDFDVFVTKLCLMSINLTSTPGTDSQTVCINTPITNITYSTTGATGIGTPSGLPTGVNATWASNVLTISGTPQDTGIFTYSIPLTGSCVIYATGSIRVNQNTATLISGAGTDSQTVCVNTPITTIIYSTTGATGIGTPTGLPAGVNATWASDTITIRGTPTESGTFNYSIPLTGGCGNVSVNGTITVNPNNTATLVSDPGTDNQMVCVNTPITNITYSTTGATGIGTPSGLPTGVNATWASDTITISGTPTDTGTFTYSILLTGGCGNVSVSGTITVNPNNTATLVSDPGTDSQTVCVNTPITTIIYSTTGATGIGTPTGLPAGVNATWASDTITISGTPTVSGTFNYSISLTGGCGNVSVRGTITVNPNNTATLVSDPGTDSQMVCINTHITTIIYSTTGATGIGTPTGLPAGVNATWASDTITISGTPTVSGTFNYSIPLTGGCGNVSVSGTITVNPNNTATLVSGTGTDNQTVYVNTPITNITYSTTGATGIGTPIGLPPGVNTAWSSNVLTISGTPTESGTFNYSIPLTGGCGNVSVSGTITVITPTGIEENAITTTWSISPNPNQGVFTIRVEKPTTFELMDITGKVLGTLKVQTQKTIQHNLPAGVYFIREKQSGMIQKLVIE